MTSKSPRHILSESLLQNNRKHNSNFVNYDDFNIKTGKKRESQE